MKIMKNTFTQAYIECALWSSTYVDSEPMDDGEHELSPETIEAMEAECDDFLAYCEETETTHDEWSPEQLGHDFWLTRNGHGTGFWDRGLAEGDALTKAAKTFGSCDLYVGDDGLIYQS